MSEDSDYKIDEDRQTTFGATFILVHLKKLQEEVNKSTYQKNSPLFRYTNLLLARNYIALINDELEYTESGSSICRRFQYRYTTTLKYLDIFSSVDLSEGIFAFEKFGSFSSDSEWQRYLAHDRWADLRVGILDYLDSNPLDFVFSQFVLEGVFDPLDPSWKQQLSQGAWWKKIEAISNNALHAEDLVYKENSPVRKKHTKAITGEDIIDDIFFKGIRSLKSFFPDDFQLHTNISTWYPEYFQAAQYGMSISIDPNSRPPWESLWKL